MNAFYRQFDPTPVIPALLSLICAGRVWWLHGQEVIERGTFVWRGRRHAEGQAERFGRAMQAGGAAFGLLGLWTAAIWLMER